MTSPLELRTYVSKIGSFPALQSLNKYYDVVSPSSRRLYLEELTIINPLIRLFMRFTASVKTYASPVRVRHRPRKRLTILTRNTYILGFQIVADIIRRQGKRSLRDSYPPWKGYLSQSTYGLVASYKKTVSLSSLLPDRIQPNGFANEQVTFIYDNPGHALPAHFGFDDMAAFAYALKAYEGSSFGVSRPLSQVGTGTLLGVDVTSETISVVFTDCRTNFPGGFTYAPRIKCFIRLLPQGNLSMTVSGIEDGYTSVGSTTWRFPVQSLVLQTNNVDITGPDTTREKELARVEWLFSDPISLFTPGLYHSQGVALSDALNDMGRNYENFVEAPALIKFLTDLFLASPKDFKFISTKNPLANVINLSKMASGAVLLKEFALGPAQRGLEDLFSKHEVASRGEGTLTLSGTSFSEMPPELKDIYEPRFNWAYGTFGDTIRRWRILMRSTVTLSNDHLTLARGVFEQYPLLHLGILPTPKGVYETFPFSFAFDWFTKTGELIESHTNFLLFPTLPLRIGHSVSVTFETGRGQILRSFYRGEESRLPVDFPGVSWLTVGELPMVSIPLLVSILMNPASIILT